MAENSQVEGVIDTHIQVPPPVRAAPQPDLTKKENEQDTIQINTQPPIPNIIVEEYEFSTIGRLPIIKQYSY